MKGDAEKELLAAFQGDAEIESLDKRLHRLRSNVVFELRQEWTDAVTGSANEDRAAFAYSVLVERCVSLPMLLGDFIALTVEPFGLGFEDAVDLSRVKKLPLEPELGDRVVQIEIPLQRAHSSTSLYLSYTPETKLVKQAIVPRASRPSIQ